MNLVHDRVRQKLEDIGAAVKRLKLLRAAGRDQFISDEDSQDIARSWLLFDAFRTRRRGPHERNREKAG